MEQWHQLEIRDDTGLSGASFVRLLEALCNAMPVDHVVVSRAEGAAPAFGDLFPEMEQLTVDDLKNRAGQVTQFDWGDFFLTKQPRALAAIGAGKYHDLLPLTDATIRAVDDTYFYVYTRDQRAADALAQHYPAATRSVLPVDELVFPD